MGRQKKARVAPIDTSNVTPATVASDIYPEGVPKNGDGTVADAGMISVSQAQRIGALTPEAAEKNKRMARTVARKRNGEADVAWGESDAIQLFDHMLLTYPGAQIVAYVSQVSPNQFQYPPVRISGIRDSAAFYDHILKTIHRAQEAAKYEVAFKDSFTKQFKGTGHVTMPNTLNDPSLQGGAAVNQPPGYPPPPPPYPYYPPQQPYGPQPVAPYAPYPPPQAPPQAAPAQPPPQQPPQSLPPDPALSGALGAIMQELQSMQQQNQMRDMQVAGVLGAVNEFKRMQATQALYGQAPAPQQQAAPPPPPPPPQASPQQQAPWVTHTQAPPPPPQQQVVQAVNQFGRPVLDAYGRPVYVPAPPTSTYSPYQQQQSQPQQRGFAGPPPPPPPPQVQPQQQMGGFGDMERMANTLSSALRGIESIRQAVGAGGAPTGEDDDDATSAMTTAAMAVTSPYTTTKIGFNDDAPVLVTREEGGIDALGTFLGNIDKMPKVLHGLADGITAIARASTQVQQTRPIQAQVVVEQPQRQSLPPVQPQRQAAPPPPAPAASPTPARRLVCPQHRIIAWDLASGRDRQGATRVGLRGGLVRPAR